MSSKDCCSLPAGSNLNHCAGCHQTFSSLAMFDRHQEKDYSRRPVVSCKPPEALGLVRDTWGTWRTPEAAESLAGRMEKLREARQTKAA
jgi:hypothetical protein